MVNRIGPTKGGAPLPEPQGRKGLPTQLQRSVKVTSEVVNSLKMRRYEVKKEGYSLGAPDPKASDKEEGVAKTHMLKWRT